MFGVLGACFGGGSAEEEEEDEPDVQKPRKSLAEEYEDEAFKEMLVTGLEVRRSSMHC